MVSSLSRAKRGFTLIELLLVIGIIAILASIVIVAVNPTRQMGQARDAQRKSDVNTILNAVYHYALDNNGSFPSGITTTAREICTTNAASCANGVNLNALTGAYVVSIPRDPQAASTATGTDYTIVSSNGRITVCAPNDEQAGADICVSR